MTREEKTLLKEKEENELILKKKAKKRISVIIKIIVIFITIVIAVIFYSRFIATSGLIVREYKIETSDIPKEFHGFKLIHFTDLHYGSTIKKVELKNIVDNINKLKPDLVVFTGDLIDKDYPMTATDLTDIKLLLKSISSTCGKYAVSGNHDYSYNNYSEILKDSDFTYLDNSYDLIYTKGYSPILLTGIGDTIKGQDDIDKAFSYFKEEDNNKNIYTISLLHEPDSIDTIKHSYKTNLALAGHSHNGQIRLPLVGAITKIKGAKKYNEAFHQVNDTSLYISGGLGTSTYKYRLFNRPSVNFFRFVYNE